MRNRWAAMRDLTPALAASLVAHLALVAAFAHTFGTQPAGPSPSEPALSLLLVPRAAVAPAEPETRPAPAPLAVPARPRTEPAVTAPPPVPQAVPSPPVEVPPSIAMAAPAMPAATTDAHVEFSVTAVLARLGDALQMRSLYEFPAEIETPVRHAEPIDVAYPPLALEEKREGTVVAWVVVDAEGRVEEISIPEGGPEFGEAVQNALLAARFLPAEDRGQAIRYFTMLEFRFRLGAPGATVTPETSR